MQRYSIKLNVGSVCYRDSQGLLICILNLHDIPGLPFTRTAPELEDNSLLAEVHKHSHIPLTHTYQMISDQKLYGSIKREACAQALQAVLKES